MTKKHFLFMGIRGSRKSSLLLPGYQCTPFPGSSQGYFCSQWHECRGHIQTCFQSALRWVLIQYPVDFHHLQQLGGPNRMIVIYVQVYGHKITTKVPFHSEPAQIQLKLVLGKDGCMTVLFIANTSFIIHHFVTLLKGCVMHVHAHKKVSS